MYDAVKMYAEAVHRVLAAGHDHRNGTRVIEEVIAAKSYYSDIQGLDLTEINTNLCKYCRGILKSRGTLLCPNC